MSDLLLEATGIAKRYGAVAALRDASLSVRAGEVHALMGANGAGKSTLVKILTGAVRPDSGTITVRGEPYSASSPAEARLGGVVSVYQEPAVIPDLDIRSNLRLTQTPVEPFRHWLQELGIGDLDLSDMARDLPLATLRVVDLARALAIEPSVLMLDEMTAALPADLTERVLHVIGNQRGSDRCIIFISHRLIEIAAVCDRATVLREGATVGVVDIDAGSEERIVALMLGERAAKTEAQMAAKAGSGPSVAATTPRLAARDLAVGGRLHDVSFELRAGEVLGVAALEGQGQDELFDILAGARRPDSGEVLVNGDARVLPAPGRRHQGRRRVRAGGPGRGAPDAALDPRERRAAVLRRLPVVGPDQHVRREDEGGRRRRGAPDRHARRLGGPPALGREPAEGDHRPLGGRRGRDDAVLRSHPRHRHRDQAADLRTGPRPRGGRRRGAVLHLRTQGDPAGLRPGDRHVRWAGRRRDPGRGGRRGDAAARGLRPAQGRPDARGDRRRGSRQRPRRAGPGQPSPRPTRSDAGPQVSA